MQITTLHTLSFSMTAPSNDQQIAATAIIKGGAQSVGAAVTMNALPMVDGADTAIRNTAVHVQSDIYDKCELYWTEVSRALSFIGVEVTSP